MRILQEKERMLVKPAFCFPTMISFFLKDKLHVPSFDPHCICCPQNNDFNDTAHVPDDYTAPNWFIPIKFNTLLILSQTSPGFLRVCSTSL